MEKSANHIKLSLRKGLEGELRSVSPKVRERIMSFDLWSFSTNDIAEQITLIEFEFYQALGLSEFFEIAWTKKNAKNSSPNILAFIAFFHKISEWINTEILCEDTLQRRIDKLAKFIDLTEKLLLLNNFNGVVEIVAALDSAPICRLKKTWKGLSSSKKRVWQRLREFVDPTNNYAKIREALCRTNPPCVPYLGMYLMELTQIHNDNPDILPQTNLLNFRKCVLNSNVLKQIKIYQQTIYTQLQNTDFKEFFMNIVPFMDKKAYAISHESMEANNINEDDEGVDVQRELSEVSKKLKLLSDELEEERNKTGLLEAAIRKRIARELVQKAYLMLEEEKASLAKCYLSVSTDIDDSPDLLEKKNYLMSDIQLRENLSEYELQARIEAKVEAVKAQITHAEHQVVNVRSDEEKRMIQRQLEILRNQEKQLEAQLNALEKRNKELHEREQQVLQREQLVSEQTKNLEQLLADLISTSSAIDVTALQQQMSNVVAGDKDVDAARRRFAGLQKAAKEAQQTLVVEERRQRERVEWLQKQMDIYRVKGMSPAQVAFRNYLKDVKRLSSVRHQLEHTPYPLRCFISYAWETDPAANKELQRRLQKLKDDLEMAGMEVTLDVRNMKDNMKTFMVQGIENAHKVLLICTPRLKARAADPTNNNLKLELKTAVAKSKTTPEFVVPLIFSGKKKPKEGK